MIDFSKGQSVYWSDKLKLEYLQRQIIVHSILYYEMHQNVIEDFQFDSLCKQYMDMSADTDASKTQYFYVFRDFTGETGYYIYDRLNEADKAYLTLLAGHILNMYKGGKRWR